MSDPNKPENLSPPLIRNKLNPKSIAKTKAIFDCPKLLNINIVASIIILSIREIIMIKINSFSSFFVANWKLNGDFKFIDHFIENLQLPKGNSKCVVICPTSIHLDYLGHKKNNFYVGAGFNAYGIAAGGGAGMALAEWVANGQPPYDLWPVDIRRFGKPQG